MKLSVGNLKMQNFSHQTKRDSEQKNCIHQQREHDVNIAFDAVRWKEMEKLSQKSHED